MNDDEQLPGVVRVERPYGLVDSYPRSGTRIMETDDGHLVVSDANGPKAQYPPKEWISWRS